MGEGWERGRGKVGGRGWDLRSQLFCRHDPPTMQAMQADSEFRELQRFPSPEKPHAPHTSHATPHALVSTTPAPPASATRHRASGAGNDTRQALDSFQRKAGPTRGYKSGIERGAREGRKGWEGGGGGGILVEREGSLDEGGEEELVVSCSPSGDRRLMFRSTASPPPSLALFRHHPSVRQLETRHLVSQGSPLAAVTHEHAV